MSKTPILGGYAYEEPPFVLMRAFSPVILLSLACLGLGEATGKHLQYSKFVGGGGGAGSVSVSSRTGMFIVYMPAFLAGVASFILLPDDDFRSLLLKSAINVHFFKRVIEVLFVHKYSGGMIMSSVILISLTYLFTASSMIYIQHLVQAFPGPLVDLKYVGVVLFLSGIIGNFYHHYLLSKVRDKKGDKSYKIPKGGLFNLVICPHYLFEILMFLGISFIAQTLFSFCFALGSALYLTGRSFATRKWYLSKFENFPKDVKALIPYVL